MEAAVSSWPNHPLSLTFQGLLAQRGRLRVFGTEVGGAHRLTLLGAGAGGGTAVCLEGVSV